MKKMVIISATGSGKKRTIPALKNSKIVEVVAIHGRNEEKLNEIALDYPGIKTYTNLDLLLKEVEFDLLYIASPPFLHKNEIDISLSANKPIICEKPLSNNFEDALYIKNKINNSSINFMLAHHLRHQPAIQYINNILKTKTLGDVRSSFMQWNFRLNINSANAKWKLNKDLGGENAFYDAGVHAIDLMLYLFGTPKSVFATARSLLESDTYDTVNATVNYDNFTIMINASQKQTTIGNDLQIYCEEGVISALQCFTETSINQVSLRTEQGVENKNFENENLYKNEVEAFCLDYEQNEGTTIDQSLTSMEILNAISNSIKSKKVISLGNSI